MAMPNCRRSLVLVCVAFAIGMGGVSTAQAGSLWLMNGDRVDGPIEVITDKQIILQFPSGHAFFSRHNVKSWELSDTDPYHRRQAEGSQRIAVEKMQNCWAEGAHEGAPKLFDQAVARLDDGNGALAGREFFRAKKAFEDAGVLFTSALEAHRKGPVKSTGSSLFRPKKGRPTPTEIRKIVVAVLGETGRAIRLGGLDGKKSQSIEVGDFQEAGGVRIRIPRGWKTFRPEQGIMEAYDSKPGLKSSLSLVVSPIGREWQYEVFERAGEVFKDFKLFDTRTSTSDFQGKIGRVVQGAILRNGRIVQIEQAIIPTEEHVAIVTLYVPGPRSTEILSTLRECMKSLTFE